MLFWAPTFMVGYYLIEWAEKRFVTALRSLSTIANVLRNKYLNSKDGRAELEE